MYIYIYIYIYTYIHTHTHTHTFRDIVYFRYIIVNTLMKFIIIIIIIKKTLVFQYTNVVKKEDEKILKCKELT